LKSAGGEETFAEAGLVALFENRIDAEAVDVGDQEFDGISADIDDGAALAGGRAWGYDIGRRHGSA
jgi:hypothetical protein